jgi:transcriptional regulator with XRE-family HTH domain
MKKDPLKKIGDEIKEARLKKCLTIDQLARESRVAAHHISNIETNNRGELPEEAVLSSFLIKVLRVLNHSNPEKRVDQFRQEEGAFIVEDLINEAPENMDLEATEDAYFKLYHIYIIIGLLVFFVFWFLLVKSFSDQKPVPIGGIIGLDKKIKTTISREKVKESLPVIDKNGITLIDNLKTLEAPKKTITIPENTLTKGKGTQELDLRVRDVAWIRIFGLSTNEVLYEGDVFPDQGPNHLKLYDDSGFIVSSGNAGAFEVFTPDGNYFLGGKDEKIKWYYPQNAKTVLKSKELKVKEKKKKNKRENETSES